LSAVKNSPEREDVGRVLARAAASFGYEDLPAGVVNTTKASILDTVGVILGGSGLGQGSRDLAAMVIDEGGKGESSILGTGIKVPSRSAALVNGGFAHALDYDNVFSPVRVHPSAITVPAALAVAERSGEASGKDLIAAVALGDELAIRIGLAIFRAPDPLDSGRWPARQWHPTLVAGYFGATVSAALVLGLDDVQTLNAFGITLYRTGGTLAYVKGARNLVAELYYGFPASVGVMSALMAARGITGPGAPFEGEGGLFPAFLGGNFDRDSLAVGYGREFEVGGIETKPWPAVRTSHAYIQAALEIAGAVSAGDIQEITIRCGGLALLASEPLPLRRRPLTSIDAKFSIPFIVSVALAHHKVVLGDFLPQNLGDPAVLSLVDRVTVRHDPELDEVSGFRGAGMIKAVLEVKTRDGETHSARVDYAHGGPDDPMSVDERKAKFEDCAAYAAVPMRAADISRVIELLSTLEELEDLHELFRLLNGRA
jgi:2-methylcitrate dehydratase PrpD